MMGQVRSALITGHAPEQLKHIPSGSVDLIITSPPYDNLREYCGYTFDSRTFRKVAKELYRVLKQGGTLVWIVGDATLDGSETGTSFEQALHFKNKCGFLLYDTMIYHRSSPPKTKRRYEQHFEYMFILTKGVPATFNAIRVPKLYPEKKPRTKAFGRNTNNSVDYGYIDNATPDRIDGNVWYIPTGLRYETFVHEHPAIFPERLIERHVQSWSNAGDVVLDPFCGSGTTGKVALEMGRKFIGIDVSAEYIAIAKRRLALHRDNRQTKGQGQGISL